MRHIDAGCPLSPRQVAVVRLAGEGLTGREIGRRLGISPNTVHRYKQIAYLRLGVHTKVQAILVLWRAEGGW